MSNDVMNNSDSAYAKKQWISLYSVYLPTACRKYLSFVVELPILNAIQSFSQLQDLDSASEFNAFQIREDVSLLLYHAGFGNEILTSATREKALQCVLLHQVFRSRREEVEDLKIGLEEGLVHTLLHSNLSCLTIVFPLNGEHAINTEDVLHLLHTDDDLSPKQQQVFDWFREYIQKLGQCAVFLYIKFQSYPLLLQV